MYIFRLLIAEVKLTGKQLFLMNLAKGIDDDGKEILLLYFLMSVSVNARV
jgi:hypothetical protein